MLERFLPAINPEKPFTTQGARGFFFPLEPAKAGRQAARKKLSLADQAPVVQTMDSAIKRINHYPVDKY